MRHRWAVRTSLPKGNWEQVAAALNGKIYAIGGGYPAGQVLPIVYEYDIAADDSKIDR